MFVGTERRGVVGELATRVFRERYGGVRGALRSLDFGLISRLIGGDSPTHGELLSLLFFDPGFTCALLDLGARDAERWLSGAARRRRRAVAGRPARDVCHAAPVDGGMSRAAP